MANSSALPGVCNVYGSIVISDFKVLERNIGNDQVLLKLSPTFIFTKDIEQIVAETRCRNNIKGDKDLYGVVKKGNVVDGELFRTYNGRDYLFLKFNTGWKLIG